MKFKDKKINILPENTAAAAGFLAMLFGEAVFLFFIMALDALPFKYLASILIALILVDAGILYLLRAKRKDSTRSLVGLILVFVVMSTLLVGDNYAFSTYKTLEKISQFKAQYENYNVVVLKEGSFDSVEDITGETVNTISMQSKQQNEAKERLITKADVQYNEEADLGEVRRKLIDDEGEQHDEILLITANNYRLLKENVKGFRKNTKSIYKITVEKRDDDNAKRIDVTEESFNVLISGVDMWGPINQSGLSDVNMIMTVNPKTKKILLTSLPRDSYVVLHSYGQYDKLTHSGLYGVNETRSTIEDYLGIDINYYVRVNFNMLIRLVNAVDGIDVYSDYEFKSAIREIYYDKGWNHLSGREALFFARERKAFPDGDMQRNINQQKVLEATFKKLTKSKVLLGNYTDILKVVEDYMQTDFSDKDIKKLAKMQIREMSKWKIEKVNITGSTGSAGTYSMGMGTPLSVVYPNQEEVDAASEKIHDIMYPVKNKQEKATESTEETTSDSN